MAAKLPPEESKVTAELVIQSTGKSRLLSYSFIGHNSTNSANAANVT